MHSRQTSLHLRALINWFMSMCQAVAHLSFDAVSRQVRVLPRKVSAGLMLLLLCSSCTRRNF
eukprot:5524140-Pleurochrysis_carterae.AAC.1